MYRLLRSDRFSRDGSADSLVAAGDREKTYQSSERISNRILPLKALFGLSLLASLIANVSFVAVITTRSVDILPVEISRLSRTVPRPWLPDSAANETAHDLLWEQTNYDRGNIILDDGYAKSMGLPRAERSPWDESKGIYLINAYHNIHCVKTIHTAVVEFHTRMPQSSPYLDIIHCLDVLRDEVMCEADDTPRYTGFQDNQKSGLGQVRMCRDWKKLED